MKERGEKGKNEEELAALRKKRAEKKEEEDEEETALKRKREEIKKELEEEQAALKKRREEIKKEREQEMAALKQKIEEEAADRDLHERLVHEITGGYTMAIVLLAGLLRFKEKPGQWNAVLEQLKPRNSGSTQDSGGEGLHNGKITSTNHQRCVGAKRAIEIVFWASFEDLPNDLKSCFQYFAGYPRNFSHSADTIVRMWVAEGFIRRQTGKIMEEVGYDYLKELVLRCLVEVEEMKVDGGIQLVKIHRSLMGFLQAEVRESGFMEIHDIHEAIVPSSVYRLSVQSCDDMRYTSTFADKKLPKLRSFICHTKEDKRENKEGEQGHHQDLKFLRWSKFLRVISVQGLKLHDQLTDELGDTMIHLRYLRIDCPHLRHLPSSISRLLSLQTLDIRNTKVGEIDLEFWRVKTLRHVLANKLILPTMVVMEGELQTLHGVKPDYSLRLGWDQGSCPLDKMTNLRSLEIHELHEAIHGHAFTAALEKMHLLGHLHLECNVIPSSVFTNPSLRSLQTMKLHGHVFWGDIIQKLPAVDRPLRKVRPNLVQLKLGHHAINEVPQSIREQLEGILIRG